jgi:hypothetical protein
VVALASTVNYLIEAAGGFIFDHAAAGWEMTYISRTVAMNCPYAS